jgi:protein MAK11
MPKNDPASRSTERPNKRVKLDLGKPLKRVEVSTTFAKAQTSISVKPNKNRATSAVVAVPAASGDASQTTDVSCATPSATFKVVAGSYEKLLYGLEGSITNAANGHQFHLKPIFIFPAHVSCIKAVAASPGGGKWLATGSADEIIKVWDLRRRKEIGGLMHHEGASVHGFVLPSAGSSDLVQAQ